MGGAIGSVCLDPRKRRRKFMGLYACGCLCILLRVASSGWFKGITKRQPNSFLRSKSIFDRDGGCHFCFPLNTKQKGVCNLFENTELTSMPAHGSLFEGTFVFCYKQKPTAQSFQKEDTPMFVGHPKRACWTCWYNSRFPLSFI